MEKNVKLIRIFFLVCSLLGSFNAVHPMKKNGFNQKHVKSLEGEQMCPILASAMVRQYLIEENPQRVREFEASVKGLLNGAGERLELVFEVAQVTLEMGRVPENLLTSSTDMLVVKTFYTSCFRVCRSTAIGVVAYAFDRYKDALLALMGTSEFKQELKRNIDEIENKKKGMDEAVNALLRFLMEINNNPEAPDHSPEQLISSKAKQFVSMICAACSVSESRLENGDPIKDKIYDVEQAFKDAIYNDFLSLCCASNGPKNESEHFDPDKSTYFIQWNVFIKPIRDVITNELNRQIKARQDAARSQIGKQQAEQRDVEFQQQVAQKANEARMIRIQNLLGRYQNISATNDLLAQRVKNVVPQAHVMVQRFEEVVEPWQELHQQMDYRVEQLGQLREKKARLSGEVLCEGCCHDEIVPEEATQQLALNGEEISGPVIKTIEKPCDCITAQWLGGLVGWKSKNWMVRSPEGLVYKGERRIQHILRHNYPDCNKPKHSVFAVRPGTVYQQSFATVSLIDEAWSIKKREFDAPSKKRTNRVILRERTDLDNEDTYPAGSKLYVIDLMRPIGRAGEPCMAIAVVIKDGQNLIMTAYPCQRNW